MKSKDTDFPAYRKLINNLAYYKIIDERNFEEIKILGSKKSRFVVEAKQYPEILKIQDMLNDNQYYICIEKKEYDEMASFSK